MGHGPAGRHVGIVGAGILGLAFARELQRRHPGVRVTVLEKEADVGRHQTGHNSGVVHAGIYYEPGSLKARLCRRGMMLLKAYCERHGLAYDECGKLIVAASADERPALEQLLARGRANGVPGLVLVPGERIPEFEPHAVGVAAIHSPRTAVVDFAEVARSLVRGVVERGGALCTSCEVRAIDQRADQVRVGTSLGGFAFDHLVVCAGLAADRIARLAGDGEDPRIVPFRGEYYRLRPPARPLVRGLVYPVPDPAFPFLGVHLTRRVDGEVLVGPNAVLAFAREGYRWRDARPADLLDTLRWPGFQRLAARYWQPGAQEIRRSLSRRRFVADARRYVPALTEEDVVRAEAGVRAQAVARDGRLVDDFRFSSVGRVHSVRNAPSPAATSSLAIAELIAGAVEERLGWSAV
ncbi:L-2-hydroxyglutarate oxidase [Egicoccus sp. AB-alg2]|uniref:L-2-hydroxyglutarate oxidase n=1 Tax=Egicoccus sp. AB-alg2 TaxID=3242693 RepID=UPI00359E7090